MDVGFFNETVEGGGRQGLSIFKFGTIGTSELEATISALKQDDKVNILSEPSVTTLNNKTALIKVVDKEAYREFTQETGETQDVTNYEWKEKETGISLEVTPHVTSNNMIMLKVIPSAKELKEYRSAPIPGTELIEEKAFPIITTREANAEVLISHGNTLVIGGLIKKSKRNTNVGVPVLSKIPVLGWAFKRKEEEIEESELMIFITPYIVNSGLNATKTN
jgi:type II secretory pathway component GspD/PulD (secretin)